jgi:hypothetical protein
MATPDLRESAKIDPRVKRFTTLVQHGLMRAHILRERTARGLSFERAGYLVHAHGGFLQPQPADAEALADLRTLLSGGVGVGA